MSSGGGDIVAELKSWFQNCPLFTKGCLIYGCTTLAILNMVTGISMSFINIPGYVIYQFQIYRLILSPLFNPAFLSLLFGFLVYLGVSARLERKWGTVKAIVDFFWKNFLINLAFVTVVFLLSLLVPGFLRLPCSGLWPTYFAFLMEQALENPDAITRLWCLPFQIKMKYYPIALWLIFSLFSGPRIELLVAMLVGYLHFKYLNNSYHAFLNDRKMASWEQSFLFNWMRSFPNFASNSVGGGTTGVVTLGTVSQPQPQPQASSFKAFKGRGITLGGQDEPAYNPRPPAYNPNQQAGYFVQNDEHDPSDIYAQEAPAYQQRPQSYMPNQQEGYAVQIDEPEQVDSDIPLDASQNDTQDLENNSNNQTPQNK